jgi:RNA polymerase sigma-70 factor (ECF subfamily)
MSFSPHDADDLLQEFLARKVVQKRVLDGADAAKGRFRVFLMTVFKNFAVSEIRRFKAKKRGPLNDRPLGLDEAPAAAVSAADAHRSFDLDWARQTVALAIDRMRGECDAKGRRDLWEVFACRVLEPLLDEAPIPSYEALVRRFGFQSPTQASNLLITAKRMFRRALEEVVRDTVADASKLEDEIRELKAILAG